MTVLDDNVYVSYNSCNVDKALARYGGFAPIEKAWIDNWAGY